MNLGAIGNAIVGALDGAIFLTLLGLSGTVQIVSALVAGGLSGGLATLLIGFLKSKISA